MWSVQCVALATEDPAVPVTIEGGDWSFRHPLRRSPPLLPQATDLIDVWNSHVHPTSRLLIMCLEPPSHVSASLLSHQIR